MSATPLDTPAPGLRGIRAVVIGGSAGSVDALLLLLPHLPAKLGVPVVVVVHVPAHRDSSLPRLFRSRLSVPVCEAEDKQPLVNGTVYFAAPGYHLSIETEGCFSLSCEEPVEFARPSIDVLMTSAADAYGRDLLGILLTGANRDGASGMAAVKRRGGITVVQDPVEARAATMPEQAIRRQAPDLVLSLQDIGQLLAHVKRCP
jgi:two-component system chemotaxis response regulator CheB